MKKLLSSVVAVGFLALSACGETTGASDAPITETLWHLRVLQEVGGETATIGDPEMFTLELLDSGVAAVKADCNRCSGSYELSSDGSIDIGDAMACTRAYCGDTSLDGEFLRLLLEATRYENSATELILFAPSGTLAFAR